MSNYAQERMSLDIRIFEPAERLSKIIISGQLEMYQELRRTYKWVA